jgi:putative acetyltransferase
LTGIVLKLVPTNDRDLRDLIVKLDLDLATRYPGEVINGVDLNDPKAQRYCFVVAYSCGSAAGCGALRPLSAQSVELKRFFVEPVFRNQGIASRMLAFLEQLAKEQGYLKIMLETGTRQPEAIGLYRKLGYVETGPFGDCVKDQYSIFFKKQFNREVF